jgi:hypothetical protein
MGKRSRPYEEKRCAACGKMFGPKRRMNRGYDWTTFARNKHCSYACGCPVRPHEEKPCAVCCKLFGPKRTADGRYSWRSFDQSKYCSRPCAAKGTTRHKYKEKVCAECGTTFGPKRKVNGGFDWCSFNKVKRCSVACLMSGRKASSQKVEVFGVKMTRAEISLLTGISVTSATARVIKGLTPETGLLSPSRQVLSLKKSGRR